MSFLPQYDVAIVGASLAGCATARLFAEQGFSVALIEQHTALNWHKRLCTHYIQACAIRPIQRLGLEPLIEQAGGVRSRMEIWTRWGWIKHESDSAPDTYGYSIRRQTLDPIVRQLAADTPGVELLLGSKVQTLLRDQGRFVGMTLRDNQGVTRDISARLIVAADGRNSPLADQAEVPVKVRRNERFTYFAYYRNVRLASGDDSQLWMLDPDVAYALPCEDGITLLCAWITKDKLADFQRDREGSFERFLLSLPDGPDLARAERVSELLGAVDLPVVFHYAALPGLALVGDAALAADPLWGVGCGWAFQSAEWLVDAVSPALANGDGLDRALNAYRLQHRRMLGGHFAMISSYARGQRFSMFEKLYFSAAAKNPAMADTILAFGARRIRAESLLKPTTMARAVWANLRPRRAAHQPGAPTGEKVLASVSTRHD
jgi:2-polyprenyl-6-methoxyphenol hydroxylase-like FAD-dependent oxidoreductase